MHKWHPKKVNVEKGEKKLGKSAVKTLLYPFNLDNGILLAVEKQSFSKCTTINATRKPVLCQFYGKNRPSSDEEEIFWHGQHTEIMVPMIQHLIRTYWIIQ